MLRAHHFWLFLCSYTVITMRVLILFFAAIIAFAGCHNTHLSKTKVIASNVYHSSYDDRTMNPMDSGMLMMPYNRFIDQAGSVVRFGNPDVENHSLDAVMLKDGKTLAVEDRFGMALIDVVSQKVIYRFEYKDDKLTNGFRSTYSGIKALENNGTTHLFWSAANGDNKKSYVLDAVWDGKKLTFETPISFEPVAPSPLALPNEVMVNKEDGIDYLYVVLNGNSQLVKIRLSDKQTVWSANTGMAPYGIAIAKGNAYVTNWAGPVPTDTSLETAGIPYGKVYIEHRTGATSIGSVSVIDLKTGTPGKEIVVGLHPTAIIASPDRETLYVANGNADNVSVILVKNQLQNNLIEVRLNREHNPFIGDSPNALAINADGSRLYVANGLDNAVAVVKLVSVAGMKNQLLGFIPTQAYPAGMMLDNNNLYVCNLEGEGARERIKNKYNAHHQGATVSIIPIPKDADLPALTERVEKANLQFRAKLSQLLPRENIAPKPVPERIGEPSPIKHVVYIIKENRTYDQVMGDMKQGDGKADLCIYGDSITPNQHQLAKDFVLLDNYYASGKSSAEGHQWTDAAMVDDYVEKNVRAWFRSYPHVQTDALVYDKEGFLWNNALDHGKTVRIYGEACDPEWDRKKMGFKEINALYKAGKPVEFTNNTTISRVRPILSTSCPCADTHDFPDVMRADSFIKELKAYEKMDGDQWPNLIMMALSDDHTAGTRPEYPTPRSMVAGNDQAVGKIIEAISHSKFWNSTAIFITEDDSQDGWDHVSAYRTTGQVISPYSKQGKTVHTNYNQTCMVRTIEQILGIPPMNTIDATALPMFDCFTSKPDTTPYKLLVNLVPIDEMNKNVGELKGKALKYALHSMEPQYDKLDGGNDDLLNHILWYTAKGNMPYPSRMTLPKKARKDDDD